VVQFAEPMTADDLVRAADAALYKAKAAGKNSVWVE
jgi:PleD family two-component response regulator